MDQRTLDLNTMLKQVEERIGRILAESDALVQSYVNEIGSTRGKRLRPRLMIVTAELFGGASSESLITCAACCELLHTATLIHDDVIDEAHQRRGMPTLNSRHGNEIAVVVGDYVLALLLRELNREHDFQLTDMLLATSQELGLGVIEEVLNRNNFALSVDKYYDVIYLKTGALFSLCCRLGAHLGGATPQEEKLLGEYGKQLGLGFQVVDDLLDILCEPEETGKPRLNDLREGRITLPLIHALAEEPDQTRQLVHNFQSDPEPMIEQAILKHFERLGSLNHAFSCAENFISNATLVHAEFNNSTQSPDAIGELSELQSKVLNAVAPALNGRKA